MPNYDFKCKDCVNAFSVNVSISERENVICPACNSKNIQQIYSSFGVKINSNKSCENSCPSAGAG